MKPKLREVLVEVFELEVGTLPGTGSLYLNADAVRTVRQPPVLFLPLLVGVRLRVKGERPVLPEDGNRHFLAG
jgi:hypothetical protein